MLFEEDFVSDVNKAAQYGSWTDRYYAEINPAKRKAMLDEGANGASEEEMAMLKGMFGKRYSVGKNGNYIDEFLREYMNLRLVADNLGGLFSTKRNTKIAKAAYAKMCLTGDQPYPQTMIYRELCNLITMYIDTCSKDKNYTAILWGVGKTSKAKIVEKIQRDLDSVGTVVPRTLNLMEESKLFTQAIEDMAAKYLVL